MKSKRKKYLRGKSVYLDTIFKEKEKTLKEASKITGYNKESAIALGAYWRYGDALCPGVLFEIKDYAIGITYDLTASKLLPATNTMGAVEITFRMQSNNQFLYKGYNPK